MNLTFSNLIAWPLAHPPFNSLTNKVCLYSQVLEFDLKGAALESTAFIDVIVKDYETIGKDK